MVYCPPANMAKTNKIRHVLATVIILVILYLAVSLVLKFTMDTKQEVRLPELPRNVELSLGNIHYSEVKDGGRKWELFAARGEFDKGKNVTRLAEVRFVLPDAGKNGTVTLRSDQAEYQNDTKNVTLIGNVVARSDSGMEFTTSRVFYDASRSLVTSQDRVRYSDGRLTVEGTGMELAVRTRNVKILKDVRAIVGPGKKG